MTFHKKVGLIAFYSKDGKRLRVIDTRMILVNSPRKINDMNMPIWRMCWEPSWKTSVNIRLIDDIDLEYLFSQLDYFEKYGEKSVIDQQLLNFPSDW
jgi:hypothetical protein